MVESTIKEQFLRSLARCTNNKDFIPSFYERFLGSSEEIQRKFSSTNFEKQNEMLVRSLKLAAGATSGNPDSLRELRDRAETHDRHHLNIEPRFYDIWLGCVIDAARQIDPDWEDGVETAWKTILGYVVGHMVKHY